MPNRLPYERMHARYASKMPKELASLPPKEFTEVRFRIHTLHPCALPATVRPPLLLSACCLLALNATTRLLWSH